MGMIVTFSGQSGSSCRVVQRGETLWCRVRRMTVRAEAPVDDVLFHDCVIVE